MNSKFKAIIKNVTDFYLKSRDFNGIPLENLYNKSHLKESEFKIILRELIEVRKIDLIYEGNIPNPHIKPFPAPSLEQQLEKLNSYAIEDHIRDAEEKAEKFEVGGKLISLFVEGIGCCVYPTPEHLQKVVDWKKYASQPFKLRLAMGEWQLRPYFFELGILAIYRNDPRYRYQTNDTTGAIYAKEDQGLRKSDDIFLKHFYFGFDDMGTRSVAVLLTDLQNLTPQHQQIWKAKLLPNSYKFALHPDAKQSILGNFPNKVSIFSAFISEIEVINNMAIAINGIPLFKKTFQNHDQPENFGFLILPTLREYESFCHTLDRMMSENINDNFFDGEISQFDLRCGQKLKELKGITKLDIWLSKTVTLQDPSIKDSMIKTLRDVRGYRSKPAHTHSSNEWNLDYYFLQRKLVNRAYHAMRSLRLILAIHPNSHTVKVDDWLFLGEIRSF